jgi:hypothetical protein
MKNTQNSLQTAISQTFTSVSVCLEIEQKDFASFGIETIHYSSTNSFACKYIDSQYNVHWFSDDDFGNSAYPKYYNPKHVNIANLSHPDEVEPFLAYFNAKHNSQIKLSDLFVMVNSECKIDAGNVFKTSFTQEYALIRILAPISEEQYEQFGIVEMAGNGQYDDDMWYQFADERYFMDYNQGWNIYDYNDSITIAFLPNEAEILPFLDDFNRLYNSDLKVSDLSIKAESIIRFE